MIIFNLYRETLATLAEQGQAASLGVILDSILAGLFVLSVFLNYVTLGKPLFVKKAHKDRTDNRKSYGMLQ